MIEAPTVAATIDAADAGVKGARVTIRDLRLADDLGGKGYVLFGGEVSEVEAAVGYGVARTEASGQTVTHVVISQLHDEMRENLAADPRFGERARDVEKTAAENGKPVAFVPRGRPLPGSGGADRAGEANGVPAAKPTSKPRQRRRASSSRRKKA